MDKFTESGFKKANVWLYSEGIKFQIQRQGKRYGHSNFNKVRGCSVFAMAFFYYFYLFFKGEILMSLIKFTVSLNNVKM